MIMLIWKLLVKEIKQDSLFQNCHMHYRASLVAQ